MARQHAEPEHKGSGAVLTVSPPGGEAQEAEALSSRHATKVCPGIWSIRLPIPNASPDHVLVYAVEAREGLILIDSGFSTEECRRTLEAGLSSFGATVHDVRGIVTTHLHPDHYGLAGRLQEESGAWVGMHAIDAALVPVWYHDQEALSSATIEWLRALGVPPASRGTLAEAMRPWDADVPLPNRLLADGERLEYAYGTLTVCHTPGHTPGHIVLVAGGAVLTGDHVLRGISPFVSTLLDPSDDPLGGYLAALMDQRLPVGALVLPGHGHPFRTLGERATELRSHHNRRLAEIASCIGIGEEPRTVWDVARCVRWFRPWDVLDAFSQRIAVGEAHAHLVHLERTGRADAINEVPHRWTGR